jgi:hypothetical protein
MMSLHFHSRCLGVRHEMQTGAVIRNRLYDSAYA